MECFYFPELREHLTEFQLPVSESKHLKSLRIRDSDKLLITNGLGLSAVCLVKISKKFEYKFFPIEFLKNDGEPDFNVSLVLGIIEDKSRFEFALEKAVELGASEFIQLCSEFSRKPSEGFKPSEGSRLQAKAISAMKQCKRSKLISIKEPLSFNQFIKLSTKFGQIILCDENGLKPSEGFKPSEGSGCLAIIVGPEGGFSENELKILKNLNNVSLWKLGNRRLRAETAAISALSLVNAMI